MSNNICPNGNSNAAFVHGINDAMHDGMDTFKAFSPCKCDVCKARYSLGWQAARYADGDTTAEFLLARIRELEEKLAALAAVNTRNGCPHCGATDHEFSEIRGVKFFICDKVGAGIGVKE